jgi:hypothetical protein
MDENIKMGLTKKGIIFIEANYLKQALIYVKKACQEIVSLKTKDVVIKDALAQLQNVQANLHEIYDEKVMVYKQFGDLEQDIDKLGFVE